VNLPSELPQRFVEIMGEAVKIKSDAQSYHDALRDWVNNGSASRFALSPDAVVERSRPRDNAKALGHAHFALATQLEMDGHHDARDSALQRSAPTGAGELDVRRQAWSLEKVIDGPLARFLASPDPAKPERVALRRRLARRRAPRRRENYSEPWRP
jgi:hypothetical protein